MPFQLDRELEATLAAMAESVSQSQAPKRGDWKALREAANAGRAMMASLAPPFPEIEKKSYKLTTKDGASIELRWYSIKDSNPGSAVVFVHGGGMIAGTLDGNDATVSKYVMLSGVPFLAVDYRLAPEYQGTTLAEDAYAALQWLVEHAAGFGVDTARIAIMGESGGGGVAAGAAILARDHGVTLAKQILIYPMLDDRNIEPDAELVPFAGWTYDNNYTGWHAVLGDDLAGKQVSPIAAPARNTNYKGLASAYIEVGELDIFRDESVEYASQLWRAGISTELHVHQGVPHGFELVMPTSQVAQRSTADRVRALKSI